MKVNMVHPTAIVEKGVTIGSGTRVWDNVHLRGPSWIGDDCIIGEKTYVAYGVTIGNRVKINAFVYVCTAVTVEDGVMISAGTIFTNDRFPRATTSDLRQLRTSEPDEQTLPTWVRAGATIGAGCVIGCDLEIGRFAMVGMGSVVTRSVHDFHLVLGNPARTHGAVCRCGEPLVKAVNHSLPDVRVTACSRCGLTYSIMDQQIRELTVPDHSAG